MTEDERRAVQADTLRRLAYFLHAQEVIGNQTDAEHRPEERMWWKRNVGDIPDTTYGAIFYTENMEEDFFWLTERADMIEAGSWTLPERFYADDPEY